MPFSRPLSSRSLTPHSTNTPRREDALVVSHFFVIASRVSASILMHYLYSASRVTPLLC